METCFELCLLQSFADLTYCIPVTQSTHIGGETSRKKNKHNKNVTVRAERSPCWQQALKGRIHILYRSLECESGVHMI